jgi:uncharacterized protein YndB with AHSA1/START domain
VPAEPYRTSIVVGAEREVVFDYFAVPELIVGWMGDYAALDPAARWRVHRAG